MQCVNRLTGANPTGNDVNDCRRLRQTPKRGGDRCYYCRDHADDEEEQEEHEGEEEVALTRVVDAAVAGRRNV